MSHSLEILCKIVRDGKIKLKSNLDLKPITKIILNK